MTGTSRSGTEQLLLTGTWDRALATVDFRPLAGVPVFVDPSYISGNDEGWLMTSLRCAMGRQGVLLKSKEEDAYVVVEPALGAYGTDERECRFGLPSGGGLGILFGLPPIASAGSGTSQSLARTNRQDAVVKLALAAYDAKTGHLIWESGPVLKAASLKDHYVSGSGPHRESTLNEVEEYPHAAGRPRRSLLDRLLRR